MNAVDLSPLVKVIDVRRSAEDAFRLFTAEMSAWWPLKTHSRARDAAGEVTVAVHFPSAVGGLIYETLNTGEERSWGEVLAYEPGRRVAFSFGMGKAPGGCGEVEVTFVALADGLCRVTLTHSHWERYGAEGAQMRGRFAGGWDDVFVRHFGAAAGLG
jgi:uncharacterized protein YndB with AHSA1/START domain